MRARFRPLFVALALVALVASGCGDDDDDPTVAGDDSSASVEEESESESASGDVEAYCEAIVAVETVGEPDIDFESATPDEIAEAAKKFAAEEILPLAEDVQAAAPEEIAEEIDVLVGATEELAETGDFEGTFGSDEVQEAEEVTHAYDLENCGWGQADVTAEDYAFAGVEEEYEAGIVSFELSNDGKEMHELVLLRKKDDTTQTFDELLELDQAEAEKLVDFVGGVEPTAPGEGDYAVAELEAGDYLAICFLPVGATPEAFQSDGPPPQGPPHFIQGMKTEFTVG